MHQICKSQKSKLEKIWTSFAQPAGAVEYTDCISVEV